MSLRHLPPVPRALLSRAALAIILCIAGCAGPKPQAKAPAEPPRPADPGQPAAVEQPEQPVVPGPAPDQMEAARGTVDALTRKADSYARSMEPVIANRRPTVQSSVQPSAVEWLDVDQFDLGVTPTSGGRGPNAHPDRAPVVPAAQTNTAQLRGELPPVAPAPAGPNPSDQPAQAGQANQPNQPLVVAAAPDVAGQMNLDAPAAAVAADTSDLQPKLAARIKDYPRDVAGHLEYQLLLFLLNEPVPNLQAIASLPSEDRELVTAVLDGLSNFRNTLRQDNNMLLSRKIRPLLDLSDRLRSQADLAIANVQLCTAVRGFADYEPIDPPRFVAGRENHAILYCEVQNFSSQLNDQKRWETKLTQDVVLYTENGQQVWGDKTDTFAESTRTRRHDYFMAKRLVLPANLVIGRYLLKVTVVDQQLSRVAEATVPIMIVAQ